MTAIIISIKNKWSPLLSVEYVPFTHSCKQSQYIEGCHGGAVSLVGSTDWLLNLCGNHVHYKFFTDDTLFNRIDSKNWSIIIKLFERWRNNTAQEKGDMEKDHQPSQTHDLRSIAVTQATASYGFGARLVVLSPWCLLLSCVVFSACIV